MTITAKLSTANCHLSSASEKRDDNRRHPFISRRAAFDIEHLPVPAFTSHPKKFPP